jgi:quercetin dioxygenase-like cupin family protein
MSLPPVVRQKQELETLPWMGGAQVRIIAESALSANANCVLTIEASEGYAAASHVHEREDELFVVLEGSVAVCAGGTWSKVGDGGVVMLPRAVPHAYKITSDRARLLNVCTPGGLDQFFREGSELIGAALPTSSVDLAELARRYGVTYD